MGGGIYNKEELIMYTSTCIIEYNTFNNNGGLTMTTRTGMGFQQHAATHER